MVAGVYLNDGSLQLEATTQFRKLLSIERSPPMEEVIKSGVVPHFVEFLMREDFHNFSAHGVPVSYVENVGDPYRDQMEECIRLIMNELKSIGITNQHTLAYQSRVGPAQWLKPYTDEVLVEHVQKGVKSLLAVPVSFMREHIETLLEINMEYKELALESGIENWGRVPALGCTSSYIYDLADAVVEALPSSSVTSKTKRDLTESDIDHLLYGVILFFGSFLAFVLLLSPTLISAFRNYLI